MADMRPPQCAWCLKKGGLDQAPLARTTDAVLNFVACDSSAVGNQGGPS
jgi:hypothetical protein